MYLQKIFLTYITTGTPSVWLRGGSDFLCLRKKPLSPKALVSFETDDYCQIPLPFAKAILSRIYPNFESD